jgi:hypothetical protein
LIISSDVDDPQGRALYEQALALAAGLAIRRSTTGCDATSAASS